MPVIFVSLLQPLGLGLAAMSTGVPLLAGLVLAMAAIYGQVVINDAIVARYVPARLRAKAFSVRYFLGFTVSRPRCKHELVLGITNEQASRSLCLPAPAVTARVRGYRAAAIAA